jgi:hypothetical protein
MRWHLRPWVLYLALALATGAAIPLFIGARAPHRACYFEVTIASDGKGFAQLFYDAGQGFREQDSVRRNFDGNTGPAVYRFALPDGVCAGLRLDPIDHPGTAYFSDAKIVDSDGRVTRRFSPDDFPPTHDIVSLERKGDGLVMRTPPGGDDPYLVMSTGGAFVPGVSLWDRYRNCLPAFLVVFAAVMAVGPLVTDEAVALLAQRSGRWTAVGGFALVAIKLWLVSGQTIYAIGPAGHDDRLFLEQASSLLSGRWLGTYSQFTLMKGPAYSFFIAAVFLLGVPLFAAQHLLYAGSCWLVVRALRPLAPNRWLRVAIFAVLLFNPITFDGPRMMRVARQDLLPSEALILVAGFTALLARHGGPKRRLLPWAAVTGAALPAFWLTREEGVWLLPCLFLLWAAAAAAVWLERKPDRLARLAVLALPAFGWAAGLGIVSAINYEYYGLFTTCEFRREEFKSAYGALVRVLPAEPRPGVVVPRETRQRIYAVSPAFAELRPYFEGPGGEGWAATSSGSTHLPASEHEIGGGWFDWALRDAVISTGHIKSGADAMAFYSRLAHEVNGACDRGLLRAGPERSGLQPQIHAGDLGRIWTSAKAAIRLAFLQRGLTSYSPASVGTRQSLILFADLTRGRLSPTPDGEHIWPKQRWLDGIRLGILEGIWMAYAATAPWAVSAGLGALLGAAVVAVVRRTIPRFLILGLGTLAAVCALVAICAVIDSTAFYAADPFYLAGCYGLVLLLDFVGWLALAEALRRDRR